MLNRIPERTRVRRKEDDSSNADWFKIFGLMSENQAILTALAQNSLFSISNFSFASLTFAATNKVKPKGA